MIVPTRRPRAKPPARKRDAAATRAAILVSAQAAFARAGYDGAGVREIASGAGVTAMLVNRYFGSKEALFGEVMADIMARPIILTPERLTSARGGEEMADALVAITAAEDTPLAGFHIMCRSAASPAAASLAREQIEAHYHRSLTAALPGPHAAERAALLLAFVAGVQIMRQMIGLQALAASPPAELAKLLRPVFRLVWNGAPAATPRRPRQSAAPIDKA